MTELVLLDQARAVRARAERTRRLAKSIDDAEAIKAILGYADELEQRAATLELEAQALQVQSQREIARQIHSELQNARATVTEIHHSLGQQNPEPAIASQRTGRG